METSTGELFQDATAPFNLIGETYTEPERTPEPPDLTDHPCLFDPPAPPTARAAITEEEASALGFPSAQAAQDHAEWLEKNGTKEYKTWLAAARKADSKAPARPALTIAPPPTEYAGPFPRKRHGHRCRRCGGNAVACYKAQCRKLPRVETCQHCRR